MARLAERSTFTLDIPCPVCPRKPRIEVPFTSELVAGRTLNLCVDGDAVRLAVRAHMVQHRGSDAQA